MNFNKTDFFMDFLVVMEIAILSLTLYGVIQKPIIEYKISSDIPINGTLSNNNNVTLVLYIKNIGNLPCNIWFEIRYCNLTLINGDNFKLNNYKDYTESSIQFNLNANEKQDHQTEIKFIPVKDAKNMFIYTYVKGDFENNVINNYYTSFNNLNLAGSNTMLFSLNDSGFKRETLNKVKEFVLLYPNLIK